MARIPVCAVISGGCLISRHRTSKQAASWPILDIYIYIYSFVFRAGRAGTLYFCPSSYSKCAMVFEVRINAVTR
jgi:hypothetical protein